MNAICIKPHTPLYLHRYKGVMQDEILYGQSAEIEAFAHGMVRAVTFYGYEGFVDAEAFISSEKCCQEWIVCEKYLINAPFAAVMSMPCVQSRIHVNLPRASIIGVCGEEQNGYSRVTMPDGAQGYMFAHHLYKPHANAEEYEIRKAVCKTALSYLGTQYLWGGKTAAGIDCSGLASVSYLMQSIIIYRDAKLKEGFAPKPIRLSQIREGDLLYFPGHIAIFLGDGRFIHSTAYEKTRGVCLASLNEQSRLYRADLKSSLYACASVF